MGCWEGLSLLRCTCGDVLLLWAFAAWRAVVMCTAATCAIFCSSPPCEPDCALWRCPFTATWKGIEVAVKVLEYEQSAPGSKQGAELEGLLAEQLCHPNVVRWARWVAVVKRMHALHNAAHRRRGPLARCELMQ